jgi:hypothetical protein
VRISLLATERQQTAGIMHSMRTTEDEAGLGDQDPEVLSYTQFRNHLGLLEWRRRRAQYEQGGVVPATAVPLHASRWRRALHVVDRL